LSFIEDNTMLLIIERTREPVSRYPGCMSCVDRFTIVDLCNGHPSLTTILDEVTVEQSWNVDLESLKMKIITWNPDHGVIVLGQSSQSGVDMVRFIKYDHIW
jgi:hypothetical protein